jgi:hypothetical protein
MSTLDAVVRHTLSRQPFFFPPSGDTGTATVAPPTSGTCGGGSTTSATSSPSTSSSNIPSVPPVVRNKKGIEWDDLLADFESAKYDQWLLNDPSHHQIGPVVARKCIDIDTM